MISHDYKHNIYNMFSKVFIFLTTLIASANAYTINGSIPIDCWGVNTTVEIDFESQPYPQKDLGFPLVHVVFNKNISKIKNSWHLGNKTFINNTLTFNLVEYQSSFGGIITFDNLKCVNDTLAEPLTFNVSITNTSTVSTPSVSTIVPTTVPSSTSTSSKPTTSPSTSNTSNIPTTKKTSCR